MIHVTMTLPCYCNDITVMSVNNNNNNRSVIKLIRFIVQINIMLTCSCYTVHTILVRIGSFYGQWGVKGISTLIRVHVSGPPADCWHLQ